MCPISRDVYSLLQNKQALLIFAWGEMHIMQYEDSLYSSVHLQNFK